jgi:hypothetical protein
MKWRGTLYNYVLRGIPGSEPATTLSRSGSNGSSAPLRIVAQYEMGPLAFVDLATLTLPVGIKLPGPSTRHTCRVDFGGEPSVESSVSEQR